jgi:hypothetical protein
MRQCLNNYRKYAIGRRRVENSEETHGEFDIPEAYGGKGGAKEEKKGKEEKKPKGGKDAPAEEEGDKDAENKEEERKEMQRIAESDK